MSGQVEVRVPDIGEFEDVPVIEVLVAAGDSVDAEQSLITLESDKATMEVPSPVAGTVSSLAVGLGDNVSEGTLIAVIEAVDAPAAQAPEEPQAPSEPAPASEPESSPADSRATAGAPG